VSGSDRQRLLARVRQMRRLAAVSDAPATSPAGDSEPDPISALQARITQLEQQLQGLQDSVHRESSRQSKRLSELEAQIQPAAISKALSKDARDRGL
jgi:hypothetical protein